MGPPGTEERRAERQRSSRERGSGCDRRSHRRRRSGRWRPIYWSTETEAATTGGVGLILTFRLVRTELLIPLLRRLRRYRAIQSEDTRIDSATEMDAAGVKH